MRLIKKQHLAILKAVSTDETRYVLNGVYFEETEGGLKATATNGRILATVETTDDQSNDYPVIEQFKNAPNTAKKAIVPMDAITKIQKTIPKHKHLPVINTIALKLSDEQSTLATTDLENVALVPTKNIDGYFPNYEQIIPKAKPEFEIAINSGYLRDLADIVEKFEEEKNVAVHMKFTTSLNPVKIECEKKGAKLTVVVMPMRLNGAVS